MSDAADTFRLGLDVADVAEPRITSTGLVNLGTTPGECWGWECASCDSASGLAYGNAGEAARGLVAHVDDDCGLPVVGGRLVAKLDAAGNVAPGAS